MTHQKRVQLVSILLLITLIVLIFAPMVFHAVYERRADYPPHIFWSKILYETGSIESPHLLFAGSVILFHVLSRVEWASAGFMVAMVSNIALGVILYTVYFRPLFGGKSSYKFSILAILLTLTPMTVSAVNFFTQPEMNLYFGYILPRVYHNPTITLLEPFAVIGFLFACQAFLDCSGFNTRLGIFISAVVTILSCFAKPVYVIALLPALGIITGYRILYHCGIHWRLLFYGVILPAALSLLLQIILLPHYDGGQFTFEPLGFFREVDRTLGNQKGFSTLDSLPLTFLLSMLFPLAVYLGYFQRARRDLSLNLSWLTLFFGTLYLLFLVEGNRISDGNFGWSAQISMFILFVATTVFFVRQNYSPETGLRLNSISWICLLTLALHLIGGAIWYYRELTSPTVMWW